MSWARTILHESAHAYVVSIANHSSLSQAEKNGLLGDNWLIAYTNQGHDFIAETYISLMADILQEFGQSKGYSFNSQCYEDLAWGGLQNTNAFGNLSTLEKNRISDNIAVELTGKDTNGIPQTQNGTNAGC